MPEPELSLLFVRPLNRLDVRYMVSGSVAAIVYGEPRLTRDVDFVVLLRSEDIDGLCQAFPVPEFYLAPPGWSAWVRSRTNPARDAEDIRELVVNVRQPNRDDHGQETSADFLNFHFMQRLPSLPFRTVCGVYLQRR